MSDDRTRHWDEVFRTRPETAVSWYEPSPDTALGFVARIGLEPDDPIVDVGTGLSRLPDRLLALGYHDITLVDVSAEAIGHGNRRRREAGLGPVEGLPAVVRDVTAWRPERRYRLWHDRAVLHFLVGEGERAAYRRVLEAAVIPGGHAVIATFAPDGPERCSGLPVRRYGAEDLETFLGSTFLLVDARTFDHVTPGGTVQRFNVGWLQRHRDGRGP